MSKINNPFRFGDPVDGDFYLSRPELMKTVRQFVDNRIHVVLIGPRRFGKTSFVLELLRQSEGDGKTGIFIDIFNITSHRDFLQQMLRGLRDHRNLSGKFWDWIKTLPRLSPKLSVEQDIFSGASSFSITAEIQEKDIKDAIHDVLAGLSQLGENVVIVIDEFQKIAEIEDDGWLEATLRSQMQILRNVGFIFTGSRQSIIHDMLNNQSRPFYRSCQPIEFPSFNEDFTDWILRRFATINVSCERNAISHLRKLVQDTPNYVQMVCFHLVALGITEVSTKNVEDTLAMVTRQNSYAYQTLLASRSALQQRVLRMAAIEGNQVYSKDILQKYEIASPAALASSFKALKNKQILDESTSGGRVVFDDPLFAYWLRQEFTA